MPPPRSRPNVNEVLSTTDVNKLRSDLVGTLAELAAADESRPALEEELKETKAKLDQAMVELRTQEGELGRLRAIAEEVQAVRDERNRAVEELAQVRADVDARIAAEVAAALEKVTSEHATAAGAWERERKELTDRIADLESRIEGLGSRVSVPPRSLASQFAAVLDELAEGPEPGSAKPYGAALTSLDVEARGIIEAGADEPGFVTVEGGVANPEELSTLRMSFRLLPRIPGARDEPAEPGPND